MFSTIHLSVASLLFASLASATIAPTSPVASTTCSGGKTCQITWKEDGSSPSITSFGAVTVGLYVGSQLSQTLLQTFGTINDPSTTMSLNPIIEANSGPNGDDYFIRFQSTTAKDSNKYPLQAFSAKFQLNNMNGSFSQAILDQIAGKINPKTPQVITATGGAAATITNVAAAATAKPGAQNANSDDSAAGKIEVLLGAGTLVVGAAVAMLF